MSAKARVTTIATAGSIAVPGQPLWLPLRAALGVEAFGVNAWTAAEPGDVVIGEHDELGSGAGRHEELYVVLDGHATFTVDGEEIDAPRGTLVFVEDPSSRRSALAREPETTVLVVGGAVGEPFRVAQWERNAAVVRFWATEDWEGAIAELERLHADDPGSGGFLYNLACAEARAGRADDALDHLAAALELEPRLVASAVEDDDLDSIRADPRFPAP